MDVGQGDGALLVTPGGETVLLDSGALNQCERPLAYLQRLGVRQIDYHIASHYHADHIGCAAEVLSNFPLTRVAYDRGGSYTTQTYSRYVATVGARRQTAPVGTSLTLEGGVALDFLVANGGGVSGAGDENDLSVVVRVRYGSFEAVIGGDLSGVSDAGYRDVESAVASRAGQVEVYKVNHHASRYSSNAQWLSTLRPKIGIVSVGSTNTFGHPTADAMARLHQAGVRTYWTSAGRGVPADPAWDFVGGDTVVDVPPGGQTFTVRASGQTHSYTAWGAQGAPPGAPTSLTGAVSGNTVTLNWSPPTTGGVPTSYILEAALAAGGPVLTSITVPRTSLTVPSVPNGTYYVRVRGVNADGTGATSNEVALVVPSGGGGGCVAAPSAPALSGSASGTLVSLSWTPASIGCATTAFAVHAGTAPGASNVTQVNVGPNTSISANAPSGTYYLRVLASNPYGSSVPSNELVLTIGSSSPAPTPTPPCSVPSAPMLMGPSVSGSTVSLSWVGVGGATSYRVLAGSAPGATDRLNAVAGSTSYQWPGAPTGTHYIRVVAINSCGQSAASNEVTATISGTPAPPPPTGSTCNGGAVPSSAACGRPTAQCRDGSWSCSQNRSGTCSSHSGVSCWVCPGPLC